MRFVVEVTQEAFDDLCWFGNVIARRLLDEATKRLEVDPISETRQMKTLAPNPVAERELRLFGDFRVMFNVELAAAVVEIVIVGEKPGNQLIVQGREFIRHHATDHTD